MVDPGLAAPQRDPQWRATAVIRVTSLSPLSTVVASVKILNPGPPCALSDGSTGPRSSIAIHACI